jgi:hypothetical protein
MNVTETEPTQQRLAALRAQHHDLDARIHEIDDTGSDLELQELKRKKLHLKDEIAQLEGALAGKN